MAYAGPASGGPASGGGAKLRIISQWAPDCAQDDFVVLRDRLQHGRAAVAADGSKLLLCAPPTGGSVALQTTRAAAGSRHVIELKFTPQLAKGAKLVLEMKDATTRELMCSMAWGEAFNAVAQHWRIGFTNALITRSRLQGKRWVVQCVDSFLEPDRAVLVSLVLQSPSMPISQVLSPDPATAAAAYGADLQGQSSSVALAFLQHTTDGLFGAAAAPPPLPVTQPVSADKHTVLARLSGPAVQQLTALSCAVQPPHAVLLRTVRESIGASPPPRPLLSQQVPATVVEGGRLQFAHGQLPTWVRTNACFLDDQIVVGQFYDAASRTTTLQTLRPAGGTAGETRDVRLHLSRVLTHAFVTGCGTEAVAEDVGCSSALRSLCVTAESRRGSCDASVAVCTRQYSVAT